MNDLEQLRAGGTRTLAALGVISVLAICAQSLATGQSVYALLAAALTALPLINTLTGRDGPASRLVLGITYPLYAAVAVAVMGGSPWQMDMHMLFFAYLASLALLADWRVIAAATVVTALHHLSLNFIAPNLIFNEGASLARVAFHAVVVLIEAGALVLLCIRLEALFEGIAVSQKQQAEQEAANAQEQERRIASQKATIDSLSNGLSELSRGNFVHRIAENADAGADHAALREAYNASSSTLETVIADVRTSAGSVNTGSGEISAASDDLARRNEQQAASLEETAAAMSQVTALVKKTAQNADQAQSAMEDTHGQAREGGVVVKKAVGAMASIEQSAKEITQIIDVIDGIAFQTNLLALNAGVEAARAGEAGKGFAVVANEVRALAQRSADAAREIKQLISTSTAHVGDGVNLVGETGTLLEVIVDQIGAVTSQVSDIAEMAETQATSLEQLNSSVGAMDKMTQQNAAMVEQSTAAARNLSEEAGRLADMVSHFRTSSSAQSSAQAPHGGPHGAPQGAVRAVPMRPKAAAVSAPPAPEPASLRATEGNLAIAAQAEPVFDDQDWSEF